MYLHLGQDTLINTKDMIGIFDIDSCTLSSKTRDFLAKAEKNKQVINVSDELPKSFVLIEKNVYISQLTTSTLKKRIL